MDDTGATHLTINSGGPLGVNQPLDLNGNKLETSSGGLTVTTNDTGNLTLDPGASNELTLSNQTTGSAGSLLAVDGSGTVVEASGTTLSDVGGGSSSSLVTSTNSVTAVEVIDGETSVSASSDGSTPPNVMGGHPSNNTGGTSVKGVTIAGGGGDSGSSNDNTASADYTTIGGGYENTASGDNAVVAGGYSNTAGAIEATVGGGTLNSATSPAATVPGGRDNTADGFYSFAAGRKAEANGNDGAFVWGDSSTTPVAATAADSARFQVPGGFAIQAGDLTVEDGNIDLGTNKLTNVSAINGGVTGNTEITDLVGSGLTINSNTLEATGSGLWTDSGDDGLLNPADSGDNGIGVTNVQTDTLTDNGSGDVTMGNTLDLNANDITNTNEITTTTASVDTLDNDGSAISVGDGLNLSNSDSIQDAGTDAIAFDGSQNVTLPNGTLDVQGSFGSGSITNSTGSLTLGTSDGISGLFLNPDGPIYTEGNKIVGLVEDVVIETETNNNSSADTKKILLTGTESDSSDTANIELSPGSNNGDVQVTNGTLDIQTGTVRNSTGALSLSTSSGDLDLQPSGNIDLNSNRISNAKEIHSDSNNITIKGTADVNLDGTRLTEKGGDMNIASVNSVNVDIDNDNNDSGGTREFNVTKDGGATTLFTVNDGGEVDIFQGDLDMNSSGSVVNTSDARLKTAIEPIANPVEKLTALEPRTYEWNDDEAADGREAGVIAQSVEDILPEAVKEDEDGFLKLAYRQLTPLVIGAVQEQQDEIENLESDLDAKDASIEDQHDRIERLESHIERKDDRIDALEAENDLLRERVEAIENHIADPTGDEAVADD
jgi:hypothetical protein